METKALFGRYYPDPVPGQAFNVLIPAGHVQLEGDLSVPAQSRGVVIFAHGSGSSRYSPRNRYVAHLLSQAGLITLLFDLLTHDEESIDMRTAELRFNVELLAGRLLHATNWLMQQPQMDKLNLGYFGASTGAAAALLAATETRHNLRAVVSRGGRPDLAGSALAEVQAPTLFIVGGDDTRVIDLNRQAMEQLRCEKRLEIISGATHLFEEPGTLEVVARLAREWFEAHLLRRTDGSCAA